MWIFGIGPKINIDVRLKYYYFRPGTHLVKSKKLGWISVLDLQQINEEILKVWSQILLFFTWEKH